MADAIRLIDTTSDARLWTVELDAPEASSWRGWLSAEEHARAARFVFARDRSRYEAAHGALRHLLASSTGLAPNAVRLVPGALGKPRLADECGIEFNLSHSQGLALIAIGHAPLGVDVEWLRPFDDWRALAAAHFTAAEQTVIAKQPAAAQSHEFLRFWTRKEACLKALGLGLSIDTRTVDVRQDRVDAAGHGALAVRSLAIGCEAIASIAFVEAVAAPIPANHSVEACA
ncbi:MAG: 4'-phosphopantetheinyl transferase superfamily protein [Variovorax sp.]|nr:MAG: 4'-phosphopantetheinyl transferase superfamily protein [Variovorax sp.]